jgi:hypothetical protein
MVYANPGRIFRKKGTSQTVRMVLSYLFKVTVSKAHTVRKYLDKIYYSDAQPGTNCIRTGE